MTTYDTEWGSYDDKKNPVELNSVENGKKYMYLPGATGQTGIVTITSIDNGVINVSYDDDEKLVDTININNPRDKKLYEPIQIVKGGKRTRRNRKSRKVKKLRRKRTRRN